MWNQQPSVTNTRQDNECKIICRWDPIIVVIHLDLLSRVELGKRRKLTG